MSEDLLIKHCSPTLAGIKTANLFSCRYTSQQEVAAAATRFNRAFAPKGVRILPLKYGKDRVLVYVFRPAKLKQDLAAPLAKEILLRLGYTATEPVYCLLRLMRRMQACPEFPHEIGLFLGYPPEDVRGFMLHKGNCCKRCGCWKVYGNEEQAERVFAKYKKCSDVYYSKWVQGTAFHKLVVRQKTTS